MNSTEIRLWIFENSFPAPFEFDKTHTSDTIKALRRHSRFVNMLVVDPNADNTAVRKSFDEAAEKMAPEVLFTIMGSDLPESTNPMETLNIEPDDLPTIVLRASRQVHMLGWAFLCCAVLCLFSFALLIPVHLCRLSGHFLRRTSLTSYLKNFLTDSSIL